MPNLLSYGIGATQGASLAVARPLLLNRQVWYVDSVTGNASYSGKDRKYPLDTIANALTARGSEDDHIIVCLSTHEEEISSVMTLSYRTTILGEGLSSGEPMATLILAGASNNIFTVSAAGCLFSNLYFKPPGDAASPVAASGSFISSNQDCTMADGCYFDSDQYSDGNAVSLGAGADFCRFRNCQWKSSETSTDPTHKPVPAFKITGTLTNLWLEGCIFDGGAVGFDDGSGNPWSFDGSGYATVGLRVEGLTLKNGADFKTHASSSGYINPQEFTGHAKTEW
jgi:hypothetical protein